VWFDVRHILDPTMTGRPPVLVFDTLFDSDRRQKTVIFPFEFAMVVSLRKEPREAASCEDEIAILTVRDMR